MARKEQLRAALAVDDPDRVDALYRTCLEALEHGLFEEILTRITPLTEGERRGEKLAWQILGLAQRGLHHSGEAHQAFRRAGALAPADPLIAHSQARTALEAGLPAIAAFTRARELSPSDASVMLGEAAALLAEGQGEEACTRLSAALEANPGWYEGHKTYARISAVAMPAADRHTSLLRALKRHPADRALWLCLIEAAMHGDDYDGAHRFVEKARSALGQNPEFDRAEAICLNECDQPAEALDRFDQLDPPKDAGGLAHILRALIRLRRFDEASTRAEQRFAGRADLPLWPYRALAWRMLGDPRWHWLEGDPRLIGTYDISSRIGSMSALADVLRSIHSGTGAPIDQSVRGGTQTDGNILARAEPEIRQLRAALIEAVAAHIAQLPPPDPDHPTLLARREPIRIAGAWSVRLLDEGFHVDHVHPQGWLSSAFYAALPEGDSGIGRDDGNTAGWLTFGECRKLLPELEAFRLVEPRVGRLALFPSTLWHGTRRFGAGERMTVALDIERPSS